VLKEESGGYGNMIDDRGKIAK